MVTNIVSFPQSQTVSTWTHVRGRGSGQVGPGSYSLAFSDSVRSVVSGLLVLMKTQERLKVM